MKRLRYPIFVAAVFLFAALVWSEWTSYHSFEGKCQDCHLTVPQQGEKGESLTFTRDITAMCTGCHASTQELSHPVNKKPTMKVPANLPLDWKGEITCVTCHPVHDEGFGDFRLRSRASGEGFCSLCHSDLGSEMHKVAVGTAHVTESTGSKYVVGELGAVLDEMSLRCLACHDAAFANDTLVENVQIREIFHTSNSIGVSHPIGVSYAETKFKYKGAYRKLEDLPKEIKLFGGIVGCGSCHNPYSKQHSELVMSNEKSALCLACHVK